MPDVQNKTSFVGRYLVRGESLVAWVGLVAVAIVVIALAGALALTYRAQNAAGVRAQEERVEAAAQVLATGVQSILSVGEGPGVAEVSAARRMVSEVTSRHGLSDCRVELPDGTVLIEMDVKKGLRALPEVWPKAGTGAGPAPREAGTIAVSVPLTVAGRGDATLVVASAAAASTGLGWEAQAGIGAIAAVSLGGMLVAYRTLRRRLGALLAIREALAMANAQGCSGQSLSVSADLGPEGQAWNTILAQRDEAAHRALEKRADEQMTRTGGNEGDLATACDALSSGMVLVDENCVIKYLNGAAAVLLGVKRDDALGRALGEFTVEPDVVRMATSAAKGLVRTRAVFEAKRTSEAEQRIKGPAQQPDERRGNKTWGGGVLRFTVRPVRRDDTAAATIIIDDVTQQKAADEARNSFVAQATHELRNPLTSIKLYVEQLIEEQEAGGNDPVARSKAINVINSESRRLERIVGDMLSVAEIEAGSLKLHTGDVRLGPLFEELKAEFEPQTKAKDLGLMFDLPPKWPMMKGDRDKISLALHNLIGNAVKYTPNGGRVTVRAAVQGGSGNGGGQLQVEVIDTGIGIKDEECELIFDKFYRAKDKRLATITGSGLGLALAREVVRMHGGDVKVQSQLDKGSTFTLNLPLAA